MFWKAKYPYVVILSVSGVHPYRVSNDLDFFVGTRLEEVSVMASSWTEAENLALKIGPTNKRYWSCWVSAIVRK